MAPKSSTDTIVRITSAQKYAGRNVSSQTHDLTETDEMGFPKKRPSFRESDPDAKTVGELEPDDFGKRVVIRSRDWLGTVYGTLVGVDPHPTLSAFTQVQIIHKKPLTFRNDTEAIVVG